MTINRSHIRTFCLLLLSITPVSGSIMAVTGDEGNGNYQTDSFYEINTSTGESIYKGSASITPNQLAYDESKNQYYYMDHTGSNLYRYDITNQTEHLLGDLTLNGMPADKKGSGGGDFYNGKYYYTPELGTQAIYAVSFSNGGSQINEQTPITPGNLSDYSDLFNGSVNAGLGDFGDFAIDRTTGLMYGSTHMSKNNQKYHAFWTIDLTDPNYHMTMIDNTQPTVYQLAFDTNNQLWANRWKSKGELYKIDKNNGAITETKTLQVDTGNGLIDSNGDFFDLASTGPRDGVVIIPEPKSITLMAFSFLLFFRRKRFI